jgi:hypothetical protein
MFVSAFPTGFGRMQARVIDLQSNMFAAQMRKKFAVIENTFAIMSKNYAFVLIRINE